MDTCTVGDFPPSYNDEIDEWKQLLLERAPEVSGEERNTNISNKEKDEENDENKDVKRRSNRNKKKPTKTADSDDDADDSKPHNSSKRGKKRRHNQEQEEENEKQENDDQPQKKRPYTRRSTLPYTSEFKNDPLGTIQSECAEPSYGVYENKTTKLSQNSDLTPIRQTIAGFLDRPHAAHSTHSPDTFYTQLLMLKKQLTKTHGSNNILKRAIHRWWIVIEKAVHEQKK